MVSTFERSSQWFQTNANRWLDHCGNFVPILKALTLSETHCWIQVFACFDMHSESWRCIAPTPTTRESGLRDNLREILFAVSQQSFERLLKKTVLSIQSKVLLHKVQSCLHSLTIYYSSVSNNFYFWLKATYTGLLKWNDNIKLHHLPPNNCVANEYIALKVILRFMSMHEAPTKNPTLCATMVFNNKNANIIKNSVGLERS